ncbi:MAG: hypothetical protein NC307_14050 [Roseburia sp.]|nr:hypothetical protein [Roseburia sp.]
MKKYRNLGIRMIAAALLLCMTAGMAACGKSKDRVVRIAQTGVYVPATAQIMQEKGILEKYLPEGVKVQWSQIATGPDIRDAIISKQVDIVDAFLKAQEETLQFIEENPEETAQILSSLYGVEQSLVSDVLKSMPPQKKVVGYDKQAQLLYQAGILEKEPTKFEDIPNHENIPK